MNVIEQIHAQREQLQKGFLSLEEQAFDNESMQFDEEVYSIQLEKGLIEVFDEPSIDAYISDLEKSLLNMTESEAQDTLEKAKKDLSKLVKKVMVDKNGKRKTVYVKAVEVDKNHNHPSDKHAEAVAVYKAKKKYMSKDKARAHVEKHFSKEHADYAHEHVSGGSSGSAGKDDKNGGKSNSGAVMHEKKYKDGEVVFSGEGAMATSGEHVFSTVSIDENNRVKVGDINTALDAHKSFIDKIKRGGVRAFSMGGYGVQFSHKDKSDIIYIEARPHSAIGKTFRIGKIELEGKKSTNEVRKLLRDTIFSSNESLYNFISKHNGKKSVLYSEASLHSIGDKASDKAGSESDGGIKVGSRVDVHLTDSVKKNAKVFSISGDYAKVEYKTEGGITRTDTYDISKLKPAADKGDK